MRLNETPKDFYKRFICLCLTFTSANVTSQHLYIFTCRIYRWCFAHLLKTRSVAAAPDLVSRMRGGDVTEEESGSSADERVFAPRSALRDLKQRIKLPSFFWRLKFVRSCPGVNLCDWRRQRGIDARFPRVLPSLPDRCCVGARRPNRGHVQWEKPKCCSEVSME